MKKVIVILNKELSVDQISDLSNMFNDPNKPFVLVNGALIKDIKEYDVSPSEISFQIKADSLIGTMPIDPKKSFTEKMEELVKKREGNTDPDKIKGQKGAI